MNDTPETPTTDNADAAAAAAGASQAAQDGQNSTDIETLRQQLEQAQSQAAAAKDAQLRAIAELDNVRRRIERDAATNLKFANERLLGELLSVCDSLELGLKAAPPEGPAKALAEGMQLTYRQLMAVLEKFGVRQIDPVGQPFNPEQHQAMTMSESADVPPNYVLSVMQKGYLLHERLLRPAMVVVAKAPQSGS